MKQIWHDIKAKTKYFPDMKFKKFHFCPPPQKKKNNQQNYDYVVIIYFKLELERQT